MCAKYSTNWYNFVQIGVYHKDIRISFGITPDERQKLTYFLIIVNDLWYFMYFCIL